MSVPAPLPPRPLSVTFGLTAAEAKHSLILLGEAMVPKAQTIHPSQCMVITDAPGKPKATTGHCDHCGGGRKLDETNCPHCAAPAPKPNTLKELVHQRVAYVNARRRWLMPWPFSSGTESGGPS